MRVILIVVLLVLFAWGLEQVAIAPLETGEVYPAYSSLRTDPRGAKALFEALSAQPNITVERLYRDRTKLAPDEAALVLGVNPLDWMTVKDETINEYEKLLHDGGRLVFGFSDPPARLPFPEKAPVEKRWNVRFATRDKKLAIEAGPEWTATTGAVERKVAAGTVVLIANSYSLSNEGLREAPDAGLVTWAIGPARHILFDENHFGVVETGSVTTLMRRYRLEGAVGVLALVAALFLWRSAANFLPPRETHGTGAVAGRDSIEGLAALLRRGVPEKDLFNVCAAEWTKSSRGRSVPQVDNPDPVLAYRAAVRILEKR